MWSLILACVIVVVTGVGAVDMCPENGSQNRIMRGGTLYGEISSPNIAACASDAIASLAVLSQPPPRNLFLIGGWRYLFSSVADEKPPINFTLSARCGKVEVCRATIHYVVDSNRSKNRSSTHGQFNTFNTHDSTLPLKYPPCAASMEYELMITPGKAHIATLPTTALLLVCPSGYKASLSQPEVGSAALLGSDSLKFVYSSLNMHEDVNVTIPYKVKCDSDVVCCGKMRIWVHNNVSPCSKNRWMYDVKPGKQLNGTLDSGASCDGLAEWRVHSQSGAGSLVFRDGKSFTFNAPQEDADVVVKARFYCNNGGVCEALLGFIVTNQAQLPDSGSTESPSTSIPLCKQQFNFTVPTENRLHHQLNVELRECNFITYRQPPLTSSKIFQLNVLGDFLYEAPVEEGVEVFPVDISCLTIFQCRTHVTIVSYKELTSQDSSIIPPSSDTLVPPCSNVYYYQTPPGVALRNSLHGMPGQDSCAQDLYFSVIDPPSEGTLNLSAIGDFLFRPPMREGSYDFSFDLYCLNKIYCKGNAHVLVSNELTVLPDSSESGSHSSYQPASQITNPQIKCSGTCNEKAWKTYPNAAMWDSTPDAGYTRHDGHPTDGVHVSWANNSIIITVYSTIGNLGVRFPTFEPISHVAGKYFEPGDFEGVVQPSSLGFELKCLANQGTLGKGEDVWHWTKLGNGSGTGVVGSLYRKGMSWYQKFGGKHIECDTFVDSCHYAPLLTPPVRSAEDAFGGWEVEINDCDATWIGTFPYASMTRLKKSDGSSIWYFIGDKQIKGAIISEVVRANSWVDPTRGFDFHYKTHDIIFNLKYFVVVEKSTETPFSIDSEFFEYKENNDRAFGINLLLYPHVTDDMETSYSEDRHVIGFKWITQEWVAPSAEQCPTCQGTTMRCRTNSKHTTSTYVGEFPEGNCPIGTGRIKLRKGPAMDTTCPFNRMHVYNRSGFSTPLGCATWYQNLTIRGVSFGSAALPEALQRAFNYEGRVMLQLMMANGKIYDVLLDISMYVARLSQDSYAAEGGLGVCRGSDYWPLLDPLGTSLPDSPFILSSATPKQLCIDLLSSTFGSSEWATVFLRLPGITPSQVNVHSIVLSYNGTNVYLLYQDPVTGVSAIPPQGIGSWWKHTHPFLSFRELGKRISNGKITVGEIVKQEEVSNVSFAFAFIPGSINVATNVEVVLKAKITADMVSTSTFRCMLYVDPMLTQRNRYGPPKRKTELQDLDRKNAFGIGAVMVVVVAMVIITGVLYITMDNNRPLPKWVPRGELIKSTLLATFPGRLQLFKKRKHVVHRDVYDAMNSGSY